MALTIGKFKVVTPAGDLKVEQTVGVLALYNEDGTPFEGGGGESGVSQASFDALEARVAALEAASGD